MSHSNRLQARLQTRREMVSLLLENPSDLTTKYNHLLPMIHTLCQHWRRTRYRDPELQVNIYRLHRIVTDLLQAREQS
jgi:hypothetical protein